MDRNMEATVVMLQEEAEIAQHRTNSHAQERKLRILQWAVIACWFSLFALLCLTVYQMVRNGTSPQPDKAETCPQISGLHQDVKTPKPRAHLTGTRQSTAKIKDDFLNWESENGLAYVEDGMTYENKSIQIPKTGYYFVYSQVSLKIPSTFDDHFVSEIIRVNDNYGAPEVLFSGTVVKHGQQTIYLAGLLHLYKGDRLKVNVTRIDQVDIRFNHKTFFGAFWVMDISSH